jgi:hypothetical protein
MNASFTTSKMLGGVPESVLDHCPSRVLEAPLDPRQPARKTRVPTTRVRPNDVEEEQGFAWSPPVILRRMLAFQRTIIGRYWELCVLPILAHPLVNQ